MALCCLIGVRGESSGAKSVFFQRSGETFEIFKGASRRLKFMLKYSETKTAFLSPTSHTHPANLLPFSFKTGAVTAVFTGVFSTDHEAVSCVRAFPENLRSARGSLLKSFQWTLAVKPSLTAESIHHQYRGWRQFIRRDGSSPHGFTRYHSRIIYCPDAPWDLYGATGVDKLGGTHLN